MNALTITIDNTPIRQDADGRYCLNDLHKASGNENKHRPSLWLNNQQTQDLIAEIEKAGIPAFEAGIPASKIQAVLTLQGKGKQGTYVVKELVYSYAMWISPAFSLKVIRAYDALVTGRSSGIDINGLIEKFVALSVSHFDLLQEKITRLEATQRISPRKPQADEIAAALRCVAEGYTFADIGGLLGRSTESVRSLVRRAQGRKK